MKTLFHKFQFVCLFGMMIPGLALGADNVEIVISSNLKPYQETLSGFSQSFNGELTSHVLSEEEPNISRETRVVVAVGGKAAFYPYPKNVRLVYCLAPGMKVPTENYAQEPIKIYVAPSSFVLTTKVKEIQPRLKRLGILWISEVMQKYLSDNDRILKELGVEIVSIHLNQPEDLPDQLRLCTRKVDALWISPDPLLVSLTNLSIVKGFSWPNKIPVYVPMEGLLEQGAVGAISSSFTEIGRVTAQTVSSLLNGKEVPSNIYPDNVRVSLNLTSAKETHILIPEETIRKADRILP